MSRKIVSFIFLFLLVIVQVSLLPHFFKEKHIPDLVLLVLIFWTVRRGFGDVWPLAVVAGVLVDFFSFFPVGFHVLSFICSIFFVGFLVKRFLVANSIWKFFVYILIVIIATAVNDFALLGIFKAVAIAAKVQISGLSAFSYDVFFKILSNLIIFAIIYWPMAKFEKIRGFYKQNMALRNTK